MKPTFEKSVDSQKLANHLSTFTPGQFISYAEIVQLLPGCDPQHRDRGTIYSAFKMVTADHGIVMGNVVGKGYKRLTDEEICALPESVLQHVRRITKRTGRKLLKVDYEKLSQEDKTKYNTSLSMLGGLEIMVSRKSLKRIETKVQSVGTRIDAEAAMELLRG